jgi:hypothetical protein
MLTLGPKKLPLCLLDTNSVSELVKDEQSLAMRHFYEWALGESPIVIPAFSMYTLLELRRRPSVFELFIERFKILPCVVVRGYLELIEAEMAKYPDPSGIEPCSLAFTPFGGEGNKLENLPWMLEQFAEQEASWNNAEASIVDGMSGTDGRYTDSDIELFVMAASLQQLTLHTTTRGFVQKMHACGQAVEIDSFPSLKAMTFTVFHKFYADATRKPARSDGFDVLISSVLPYVEIVVTEVHQAEALRKTKRRDDFLANLDVYSLRDLRKGPLQPVTATRSL